MDAFCFTLLAEKIDNNPEFKDKIMDVEKFESLIHQDFFERNDDFAYWLNFYHLHIWMVKQRQNDWKDWKNKDNLEYQNDQDDWNDKNTIQYFQLTNEDLDKLWMDFNLDNLEQILHTTQSKYIKSNLVHGDFKINKLILLTVLPYNRYSRIKKEHLIQLKQFILDAKIAIKNGLAVFYVAF